MKSVESKIQQACIQWFRMQYPEYSSVLFAIPNGGKRDGKTGAILKREGVVAGVSDLIFLKPNKNNPYLCIEMKTPRGTHQPSQKAWQKEVEKQGGKYLLCRSIDQFIQIINNYLNDEI